MIWTVKWNLRRNGKTYGPGDTLDGLTEKEARAANLYPGVLEPTDEAPAAPDDSTDEPLPAPDDIDITDAAAELAAEHSLDLSDTIGSGEGGRILKSDVERLIDAS